jgi:hypothetical protein
LATPILEPLDLDLISFGPPAPGKTKPKVRKAKSADVLGLAELGHRRGPQPPQPADRQITESRVSRLIRLHQEEAEYQRRLEEEWSTRAWFTDVDYVKVVGGKVKRRATTL